MTRSIEETPVIQWDYSFLKTHEDDRTLTVLNAYDTSGSGAGFSTVVDRKGPSESAVKWGLRVLDQLGYAAVILQPDLQER